MNKQITYYVQNMLINEEIEIDFPVNDLHLKLSEIGITPFNNEIYRITGCEGNISAEEITYLDAAVSDCVNAYEKLIRINSCVKLLQEAWEDQVKDRIIQYIN